MDSTTTIQFPRKGSIYHVVARAIGSLPAEEQSEWQEIQGRSHTSVEPGEFCNTETIARWTSAQRAAMATGLVEWVLTLDKPFDAVAEDLAWFDYEVAALSLRSVLARVTANAADRSLIDYNIAQTFSAQTDKSLSRDDRHAASALHARRAARILAENGATVEMLATAIPAALDEVASRRPLR